MGSAPPPRGTPPPAGEVQPFHFPAYVRRRLDNGLTMLAAHTDRAPLVALGLVFPAGGVHDPEGASGVAAMTSALLDEGTERSDARQVAGRAAALGDSLSTGANWDVGYVEIEVLRHQTAEGLEFLAELATSPTFPPEEIERQRRRHLTELLRRRSDPGRLADEHFARQVYGDTAYGRTLLGDEASLTALDRPAISRFFAQHYPLAGAFLIAAGDLDPEELARAADRILGGRTAGPVPPPPAMTPPTGDRLRVVIVDRPRAAQTELRMGHAGVSRSDPDFLPLGVMNAILGGKFTSRINLNLRERNGYTYGANSQFTGRLGPGPFQVATAVDTGVAGAAVREVLGEIERIRETPVEPEELTDARSYLVGTFPYTLQTVSGIADRLEAIAVYDLPGDFYQRFPEEVAAVDESRVLEVARRHLHPERTVVVAVGPAAELEPQLAELAAVSVLPPAEAPQPAVYSRL